VIAAVAAPVPQRHAAAGGLHLTEWAAEAAGSALLLLGGLSAVYLDFGPGSWVAAHLPSTSLRLLLTGALFAAVGVLVVVSPLGRRSGGHLNPAVTLAFRITGHVHDHDVAGYITAQVLGALAGAAACRALWGHTAASLGDGATHLGMGIALLAGVGIEALMTGVLLATILLFVSHRRLAPWTPAAVWLVVTLLVWRGAPYTGTSLNPARSIGPAMIAVDLREIWVYVAGPLLGAVVVALAVRGLRVRPLTAKLCHDERYPSTLASELPVAGRRMPPGPR
jgi:aquaporin Z